MACVKTCFVNRINTNPVLKNFLNGKLCTYIFYISTQVKKVYIKYFVYTLYIYIHTHNYY